MSDTANPLPELAPGYRLQGVLGTGGMATVYRALDERLARAVAVKVPHLGLSQHPDFRARFLREARALAQCTHPNVIQVHLCAEANAPTLYMVTELVSGPSLAAWCGEHGRLPWEIAVALVERCLAGLEAAHARGVLHRDLKPANVLMAPGGVPKLADFGLARVEGATAITASNAPAGTLRYLPPEALEGPVSSVAQDIYAMGALLYELVAGRPAYPQDSVGDLLARLAEGQYAPLEELSPEIWPEVGLIVETAMARDPGARYATAEAMRVACQELLQSVGLAASEPVLAARFSRPDGAEADAARRREMAAHLAQRARLLALDGKHVEAMMLADRAGALVRGAPTVQPSRPAAAQPATVSPSASAASRDKVLRLALLVTCLAGLPLAHWLWTDAAGRRTAALAVATAQTAVTAGMAGLTRPAAPLRAVALGLLAALVGLALVFAGELHGTFVCDLRNASTLRELIRLAGGAFALSGLACCASLFVGQLRSRSGRDAVIAGGCAALLCGAVIGYDQLQSLRRQSALLTAALTTAVPYPEPKLKLGAVLGHALPHPEEERCIVAPSSPTSVAAGYARAGLDVLAVQLSPRDLAWTKDGPGAALAQETLSAIRAWPRETCLLSIPEYALAYRGTRQERYRAYGRFLAEVVAASGASSVDLLMPDLRVFSGAVGANRLDECEALVKEQALTLRSRFPTLKIGVTAPLMWTGPLGDTYATWLARMAARPWIDWVGAQGYGRDLPRRTLEGLAATMRFNGTLHKLVLLTAAPCTAYGRPTWKQVEDAAAIRLIARFAQATGIRTWIHTPMATFSAYGWWFGSPRPADPSVLPLQAFREQGVPPAR